MLYNFECLCAPLALHKTPERRLNKPLYIYCLLHINKEREGEMRWEESTFRPVDFSAVRKVTNMKIYEMLEYIFDARLNAYQMLMGKRTQSHCHQWPTKAATFHNFITKKLTQRTWGMCVSVCAPFVSSFAGSPASSLNKVNYVSRVYVWRGSFFLWIFVMYARMCNWCVFFICLSAIALWVAPTLWLNFKNWAKRSKRRRRRRRKISSRRRQCHFATTIRGVRCILLWLVWLAHIHFIIINNNAMEQMVLS